MIVPDFWAEARTRLRAQGRSMALRRFGWSNDSQVDAQAQAEARLAEAVQLATSGKDVLRREHKLAYNGGEGLPIREEVLARFGEAVITRNAYGARCLNVPDLLIADVDFETKPSGRLFIAFTLAALLGLGALVVRSEVWAALLAVLIVAPIVGSLLSHAVFRLQPVWAGSPTLQAQRRARDFMARHGDWCLRLYQTPAGLRMIATHARFPARSDAVKAFFEAVGADPLYTRMCRNQNCFRARLSAKPWRVGIKEHLKPRPGVWPIPPERQPARAAWVEQYERATAGHAACRYLETLGTGAEDPGLTALIALHDAESQALDSTRPIA